jgi:hypothetical protein
MARQYIVPGRVPGARGYHEVMKFPRTVLAFLALSWILVVLYPDPTVLVRSVRNTLAPRPDPAAARAIAARLPKDPRLIEAYVLDRLVPYAYDWQSAGVPWYFPTAAEALTTGRGDCESRALALASILTAKGIPNQLRMSFNHIWVDYPGKQANTLENAGVVFAGTSHGHFFIHWPKDFNLGQEVNDNIAIFWTPAPLSRVLLLFGGLLLIMAGNALASLAAGNGLAGGSRAQGRELPAARTRRRPGGSRASSRKAGGLAAGPQRV